MFTLVLLIILLLLFLFIGMPVSLSILLSGVVTFIASGVSLENVSVRLLNGIGKYELLAVPMFIFLGNLLNEAGLAKRLIDFAKSLVGFMRGGLPMVNVVTGMFLAEMSGAGTADAAVLSKVFVPAMSREGYAKGFSGAVTCAASSLAIIIPPSIPMIIMGIYINLSVAKLFLAALIPGMLLVLFELVLCYILAVKYNFPRTASFSFKSIWEGLKASWLVLLIPVVILGSVFTGIATITESAEIALLLVIIESMIYSKMSFKRILGIAMESINLTSVILLIVAGSTLISWIFANEQVGDSLVSFITSQSLPESVVLFIIALLFIFLGTFLHGSATIIIVGPLLVPVMNLLGVDLLQYGIILTIAQGIGQMTPPVASVLYTVSTAGNVSVQEILKYLLPFLGVYVLVLLLVTYVPFFTTFIPAQFGN